MAPKVRVPVSDCASVSPAYFLDLVGALLELPEGVLELSPFRHLAAVPAVDIDARPALLMLAGGLLGVALGVQRSCGVGLGFTREVP